MTGQADTRTPPRVVVGVDSSLAAEAALRWAVRHAELTGARLELVHAHSGLADRLVHEPGAAAAQACMTAALQAVVGQAPYPVGVGLATSEAAPGPALVATAEDADLLVVGTHGRGPIGSALLGSTSAYCARHAPCPVVIVPETAAVGTERIFASAVPI